MNKPEIQEFEKVESAQGYDIHEVMNFISEKYGFDCYDVFDSGSHFNKWCDSKGYGKTDPAGKERSSSNIWFAEYQKDPEGNAKCPQYATVIDWFIDKHMPDQTYNEFNVDIADFAGAEVPDYMKEFAHYLFAEFGTELTLVLSFED